MFASICDADTQLSTVMMEVPNDGVRTGDGSVQDDPQQVGIPQTNRRNPEPTEHERYQLFLYAKLHPKATQATTVNFRYKHTPHGPPIQQGTF